MYSVKLVGQSGVMCQFRMLLSIGHLHIVSISIISK